MGVGVDVGLFALAVAVCPARSLALSRICAETLGTDRQHSETDRLRMKG